MAGCHVLGPQLPRQRSVSAVSEPGCLSSVHLRRRTFAGSERPACPDPSGDSRHGEHETGAAGIAATPAYQPPVRRMLVARWPLTASVKAVRASPSHLSCRPGDFPCGLPPPLTGHQYISAALIGDLFLQCIKQAAKPPICGALTPPTEILFPSSCQFGSNKLMKTPCRSGRFLRRQTQGHRVTTCRLARPRGRALSASRAPRGLESSAAGPSSAPRTPRLAEGKRKGPGCGASEGPGQI